MKIYRISQFGLKDSIRATLSNLLYHINKHIDNIINSPISKTYDINQTLDSLCDSEFLYSAITRRQSQHAQKRDFDSNKKLDQELSKIPSLSNYISFLDSGGWYHFGINNPPQQQKFKTYVTVQKPYSFTFDAFKTSIDKVIQSGFQCNVKIHKNSNNFSQRIDSIVIHASDTSSLEASRRIFLMGLGGLGSRSTYSTFGVDEDSSFNDIIAKQVTQSMQLLKSKNIQDFNKLKLEINNLFQNIETELIQYYSQYMQ
jgi:hypothetical protein